MLELVDTFNREHRTLRISVTDRCQMRCFYCMPHGMSCVQPHENILRFEEILRIVRIGAELGISRIRLTGGEPLIRRNLPKLIELLRAVKGVERISLTTNGLLLKERLDSLIAAGLEEISVSLDTVNPATFAEVTGVDALRDVIAAVDAALASGKLEVSLNALAVRGRSEQEINQLINFALVRRIFVRFIEFMPFDAIDWNPSKVLTGAEILTIIDKEFGAGFFTEITRDRTAASASKFTPANGAGGGFGLITSVSKPFCSTCDRLRLRSDGVLFNCLFSRIGFDMRPAARSENDGELRALFREAVKLKSAGGMTEFSEASAKRARIMSSIGG